MKLVKFSFAFATAIMFAACGQDATKTETATTTTTTENAEAATAATDAATATTASPASGAVSGAVSATQTTTSGTAATATKPTEPTKPVQTGPVTTMQFKEMRHDFGKMKIGDVATHVFEFTNTGKEPLIITDAKGSCGCTVPKYPQAPIAPGKTEKITVEFKPKAGGKNAKDVTVTANTNPATTKLFITADVEDVKKE